jgi:hypothetical protein
LVANEQNEPLTNVRRAWRDHGTYVRAGDLLRQREEVKEWDQELAQSIRELGLLHPRYKPRR